MKKSLLSMALAFISVFAWADEGMWLMTFIERLKYSDWEKEGLNLTPEEIYSINSASLKDAIVQFGGYCTGEMISDQGLLLTNHHCGYGVIAELSTEENDYLKDGYWAYDKSQELKPESLYVRYLVRMDDATDRILKVLNPNMTEAERSEAIRAEFQKIENENNEDGKYVVEVKSFYGGNEFYYFVYQDYTDVRFVGAPPSSIGKYGGDTDNWEWPRHTGDFSLFRVYADRDGNPAAYSENNVPLKPKHALPVKVSGVKPGDFSMTIGYPGSTERYMSSYGIEQAINVEYPTWVEAANTAMVQMKKHMDKSDAIRLKYASQYSSLANYWKNRIGMIEALNKLNTVDKKRGYEADFRAWAKRNPAYSEVLNNIEKYYSNSNDFVKNRTYIVRGFLRGSQLSLAPYRVLNMYNVYAEQSAENKTNMLPKIKEEINSMYEGMEINAELDIMTALLKGYDQNIPVEHQIEQIKYIKENYGGFDGFAREVKSKSIYTSADKVIAAFETDNKGALVGDILAPFSNSLIETYRNKPEEIALLETVYNKNYRLFIDGLRKTYPNRVFYPDANFTMRLSTGKVIGLPEHPFRASDTPENYYTTLKGGMAKFMPGDEQFDQPLKLIKLYNQKDFGRWANEKGELPVNFLSDNDITGGNSGSPVIGGNGELIGLAFDGNWEAMSGDIEFEKNLQRTINVDIRYVLFIIDKFAGATNLIDELELVE
ncbi:S46 family peptidase [Flavobacteriaceae bacterium Ap0902]|nr:S46 family peptidase [Flavobacteriaceae bacterium Ap0902]